MEQRYKKICLESYHNLIINHMKYIIIVVFFLFSVGITAQVHKVDAVDYKEMTEAKRDALTGVSEGFTIFNTDTKKLNIYNGTTWSEVGGGDVASVNGQTGVVVLTKGDVVLGNVDNTTDLNKPISTATATALSGKVDLAATKANSIELGIKGGDSGTDYYYEIDLDGYTGEDGGATIDATVIDGSNNAVSGNGVFDAISAIDLSVASKVKVESGVASYANGIVIPSGVTSIAAEGFNGLKISSLTLPNSLISIGNNAFQANSITSLIIPNATISVGNSAFYGNKITSLNLGSGLTSIGTQSFQYNKLTTITIPSSVTNIGNSAFAYNELTSFTWNTSLTEIPNGTFSSNLFTSVTIPAIVTSIGDAAFQSCASLTSVTVHSGVTNIGTYAFSGTAITAVSLPTGITLGLSAFPAGTTITYY